MPFIKYLSEHGPFPVRTIFASSRPRPSANMFRSTTSAIFWGLLVVIGIVQCEPLNEQISLSKRATIGLAIPNNFPDPSIIKVNGTWYSFGTHTRSSNVKIQIARSTDFENWSVVKKSDGSQVDALPVLPAWVNQTNYLTWAPDVSQLVRDLQNCRNAHY